MLNKSFIICYFRYFYSESMDDISRRRRFETEDGKTF